MAEAAVGTHGGNAILITPALIASEALMRLEDALFLPKLIDRQFEPYFSDRIGNVITYKKPYYAQSSEGREIQESDYQPLVDEYGTMRVDRWRKVPFRWNSEQLMAAISDLGRRYLSSGVQVLAHAYDESVGKVLGQALYKTVGTPGTAITEAIPQSILARAEETSIPMDGRFFIMDPTDLEAMNVRLQDVQAAGDLERTAIEKHHVGPYATFDGYMSTNLGRMTCANPLGSNAPMVNAAGGYEGNMVPTDGWDNRVQKVLNKGQIIQFPGVYETAVLGDERRSTGRLMDFTVTADVMSSATGTATIPIEPALNAGTLTEPDPDGMGTVSKAMFQNVTAKAPNDMAPTIMGTAGKTYRLSVWCTKTVATLANVAIIPPEAAVAAGNAGLQWEPDTGLSISILRSYGFDDYSSRYRMDSRWGVDACYPAQGIRCVSSEILG